MGTTTFQTLYQYAQRRFHNKSDATALVIVKECVNRAMRRIAERDHPYFIKQGYINLVASYSSGTVAVSEGGTTVKVTTGTWTSAMEGRYIKIADERVHYKLTSFDGTDTMTFDGSAKWVNDAETAATYVMYQDIYDLPSGFRMTGKIIEKRLLVGVEWLNNESEWFLKKMLNHSLEGRPRWALMANGQLYLWPYESDISVLPFLYYRWPTEMSADADTMDFDDNQVDLVRRAIDWEIAIERGKESLIAASKARYEDKERKITGAATQPHETVAIGGAGRMIEEVHYTFSADED
jgi:hypothetical protein